MKEPERGQESGSGRGQLDRGLGWDAWEGILRAWEGQELWMEHASGRVQEPGVQA